MELLEQFEVGLAGVPSSVGLVLPPRIPAVLTELLLIYTGVLRTVELMLDPLLGNVFFLSYFLCKKH